MTNNEKAKLVVTEAIDELNEQLPKEEKIKNSMETALMGKGGNLDSLRLVSLVTTVEQKIEEKFGMTVTLLADVDAFENNNPFSTVSTLADYVASVMERSSN